LEFSLLAQLRSPEKGIRVANGRINNALRRIPVEREHRFRECTISRVRI